MWSDEEEEEVVVGEKLGLWKLEVGSRNPEPLHLLWSKHLDRVAPCKESGQEISLFAINFVVIIQDWNASVHIPLRGFGSSFKKLQAHTQFTFSS